MNTPSIATQQEERRFLSSIKEIVRTARSQAYAAVNIAQLKMNWLLGLRIVEQEQQGNEKAQYGKYLIRMISQELTREFGKGYTEQSIRNSRQFYLTFRDTPIPQTLFGESAGKDILLSWSHYLRLMRVDDATARNWYLQEAASEQWSVRTLDRNINTQYFERLLLSQQKAPVIKEMQEKTQSYQNDKMEFIKNPIVAEFLGLSQDASLHESSIEAAIISNLQKFLMELGKGYAFVARQQHIRTEENDYFIDLVFYNYILKCFVIIDLKTDKISYQDVGQMDMYLQLYDQLKRSDGDNPTIGIILCSETDQDVARYSTLAKNDQLFASKYKLYLPTKEELRNEIERQKALLHLSSENA